MVSSRKYKQIVSSGNEVGLIELLSVIQPDRKKPQYLVLDGHLRVLGLKELVMSVGPCLSRKPTKVTPTTTMSARCRQSPSTGS